jgi:integrase
MRYAVKVYLRQKAVCEAAGLAEKNDYVFLPQQKKRDAALKDLQKQMAIVLDDCDLRKGPRDEERSLYSLRHTCIMYRLLYGEGLDLLTLARNARTSPEMIDRFYARHLSGEMNIGLLQSKRRPAQKPAAAATAVKAEETAEKQ